jgi:hypothetical protein
MEAKWKPLAPRERPQRPPPSPKWPINAASTLSRPSSAHPCPHLSRRRSPVRIRLGVLINRLEWRGTWGRRGRAGCDRSGLWKRYGSVCRRKEVEVRAAAPRWCWIRKRKIHSRPVRSLAPCTASTSDLATARKGVVRSEVTQREAAVEGRGIPRTTEPVASPAAG